MEEDSVVIATCSKCNSKMKIAKCPNHSIANVILHNEQNKSYWVTIFNDLLQEIAKYTQNGAIPLEEQLLSVPP